MTFREACKKLAEEYPCGTIIGYWKKSDGFVINTKISMLSNSVPTPGQFMVTNDGEVYPVNPVTANLSDKEYVSIMKFTNK